MKSDYQLMPLLTLQETQVRPACMEYDYPLVLYTKPVINMQVKQVRIELSLNLQVLTGEASEGGVRIQADAAAPAAE